MFCALCLMSGEPLQNVVMCHMSYLDGPLAPLEHPQNNLELVQLGTKPSERIFSVPMDPSLKAISFSLIFFSCFAGPHLFER